MVEYGKVVGRFLSPQGTEDVPLTGSVVFTPRSHMVGSGVVWLPDPVRVELDAEGRVEADLLAPQDGVSPASWSWEVCFRLSGEWEALFFPSFDFSLEPGEVVDLSAVSPLPDPVTGEWMLRGERGEKGDKGDPGKDGRDGAPGPRGEKGETGPAGPQGTKGDRGDPGPVGATGARGEPGASGPQGEPGPVGPVGPQGDTGPRGEPGPRGEKGDPGDSVTGPAGPQGEPGKDAEVPDTGWCDVTDYTVVPEGVTVQGKIFLRRIGSQVFMALHGYRWDKAASKHNFFKSELCEYTVPPSVSGVGQLRAGGVIAADNRNAVAFFYDWLGKDNLRFAATGSHPSFGLVSWLTDTAFPVRVLGTPAGGGRS